MWSPSQYERFKSERHQPFSDLLALIERHPRMRVVDLGCGTGELTRELHQVLEAEETLGIDQSEAMLLAARSFEGDALRFERGDIEAFVTERPYDLVFSNSVLHWVESHQSLFARLTELLGNHGQIAVQMPDNDDHPSHSVAADVALRFGIQPRPSHVLDAAHYAELLHRLGYQRQTVRLQVYGHLLPSTAGVVEWVRGALLTHYQALLTPEMFEPFLEAYRTQLASVLGNDQPYFYTYKRILIWGSL